jgi:hypothetical protein
MLAHLIKVKKGVFKSAANRGHASQRRTLQLFALEERLRVFEESDIVSGHNFDQMLCGGELTKRNTEMVGIVECI